MQLLVLMQRIQCPYRNRVAWAPCGHLPWPPGLLIPGERYGSKRARPGPCKHGTRSEAHFPRPKNNTLVPIISKPTLQPLLHFSGSTSSISFSLLPYYSLFLLYKNSQFLFLSHPDSDLEAVLHTKKEILYIF